MWTKQYSRGRSWPSRLLCKGDDEHCDDDDDDEHCDDGDDDEDDADDDF